MQATRRFWLAAAGMVALLVGRVFPQAQANKLLPDDTELIVTINVQQILKSEVLKANKTLLDLAKQKIEEQLENNPAGKFFKKANFDLFTDLHSITVAAPGARDAGEGVVVLEGKFDAAKIEAAATEAVDGGTGLKVIEIAKTKAFEITIEDQKTIYVGVLSKKIMIATTSKADYTEAVARLNGVKQAAFKAEVRSLLKTTNNKQSISVLATSAVMTKLADKAPAGAGDQIKKAGEFLKGIEGLSMAITIEKNIDFQLGVNSKDEKSATDLANIAKFGIGVGKQSYVEKAKTDENAAVILAIINSVTTTVSGSNVLVRGQLTFENLEKLLQNLPGQN